MHLFRLILFAGFAWLLGACSSSRATTHYGPIGFWHPNRFDRHGLEQGRWRTYYDDEKTKPYTAGRYRHGRPVRTFNYYAPTGALDHSEQYSREGLCEITYWYPSGKVARRGQGQLVSGEKGARFYWYGPWTSYTEDGQTTGIQTYTDGKLTRAETYENGKLTRVETYNPSSHRVTRVEQYEDGRLIKAEDFEKGLPTGTTNAL